MGLSIKLSCESGSFSCHLNPHRCFQSEVLRLYFPALDPWVETSVSLRSCFSQFIHMQMWDHLLHQPPPFWVCQSLSCPPVVPPSLSTHKCGTTQSTSHCLTHQVLQPQPCCIPSAPVLLSSPPTSLDEYSFFNTLVFRLPYSSIFW